MRLTCRNDSFPLLPHQTAVDLIAGLGFEATELIVIGNTPGLSLDEIRSDVPAAAETFGAAAAGHGLEWSDLFLMPWNDFETMAPNNPDPRQVEAGREVFRDGLELAARLGAPGVSSIPGIDWPDWSHEESLARAAQELKLRADEARERGLRFSIEPHLGSVCIAPEDSHRLCELAPGLELALDYSHFVAAGYPESELEALIPRSRHFHLRSAAPGRLQTSLRENTIDFERSIDALHAHGYEGSVLVEYLWAEYDARLDPVDIVSETVLLRDRIRSKLAEL
jgi:sugar phosphate isomerase/epimerase